MLTHTHISWIFYFKQPERNTNPSVVSLIPNMINLFTIFNNLIPINDYSPSWTTSRTAKPSFREAPELVFLEDTKPFF